MGIMLACLDIMKTPGIWSAPMENTLLSTTMTIATYLTPSLFPKELECTWTGQLALCPSTVSHLTHSPTSTQSTPGSLSPSIQGFMFGQIPQCPCARLHDPAHPTGTSYIPAVMLYKCPGLPCPFGTPVIQQTHAFARLILNEY